MYFNFTKRNKHCKFSIKTFCCFLRHILYRVADFNAALGLFLRAEKIEIISPLPMEIKPATLVITARPCVSVPQWPYYI